MDDTQKLPALSASEHQATLDPTKEYKAFRSRALKASLCSTGSAKSWPKPSAASELDIPDGPNT